MQKIKIDNRVQGEVGFSIIELVVIMAIIAVLAAVAIPDFKSAKERAKIQVAKEIVKQITVAEDFYSNENLRNHPTTAASAPFYYLGAASGLDDIYKELSLYLKDNPKDVLGGSGWCVYQVSADRTAYTLTIKANDAAQTLVTAIRRAGDNYKSVSATFNGEDMP